MIVVVAAGGESTSIEQPPTWAGWTDPEQAQDAAGSEQLQDADTSFGDDWRGFEGFFASVLQIDIPCLIAPHAQNKAVHMNN
jgi:hypothetical protein